MKERTLIKICIISIIVGLIIMYYTNRLFVPEDIFINQISESSNFVKIRGYVNGIETSESGTTFIEVSDETGRIDVVVFKNSVINIGDVKIGSFVEIVGRPEKYKEKMEIIANKIQLIRSDFV